MEQLTIYDYEQKYQSRFQIYLDYMGKNSANEVKLSDFMEWINKHVQAFKKTKRMHRFEGLNEQDQKEFTEYLKGVAKQ